jgi:transposase
MKQILKQAVGIDIDKDKFQVCFSVIDNLQKVRVKSTRKFPNKAWGFEEFDEWVEKFREKDAPLVYAMEATGVYYEQLAWHLHKQKAHVSILLPNKARKYAECLGQKSKNDRIDAKGLAQMAAEQSLDAWAPLSEDFYRIRALTREIEGIQKIRTMLGNQMHALRHAMIESKSTMERLEEHMELLHGQLGRVEAELEEAVRANAEIDSKIKKIAKVKGLGLKTVATVVAETNGFALIENQRQLVSYAGYDVVENQSGKRAGKTRISKKGNSHIRRILHMPAFNVVRYHEPRFEAFYEKLVDSGKTKMQAYVAIQKKLLVLIYTLWKNGEEFHPNHLLSSGNDEPKPLFSLGSEGDTKVVAPERAGATQDELPCNESPEALFSLKQIYYKNIIHMFGF